MMEVDAKSTLLWSHMTPLGSPVLPEVYTRQARSRSMLTMGRGAPGSSAWIASKVRTRPSAGRVEKQDTPRRRDGTPAHRSWKPTTRSSMSRAEARQLLRMYFSLSSLVEALMRTKTPPAFSAAKIPTTASTELCRWMATRSPRPTPASTRARPRRSAMASSSA